VAEDAVLIAPVSNPQFPDNREFNREFFNFGAVSAEFDRFSAHYTGNFNGLQANSLSYENREFAERYQGFSRGTGESAARLSCLCDGQNQIRF
jgi:hypothetical protein